MKDRGRQGRKEGERESLMQGNKVMCDRGDAKSTILVKTYREKVRKREREREGERGRERERKIGTGDEACCPQWLCAAHNEAKGCKTDSYNEKADGHAAEKETHTVYTYAHTHTHTRAATEMRNRNQTHPKL